MTVAESDKKTELTPAEFETIRVMLDRESAIQVAEGQEYLIESRLGPLIRKNDLGSISKLVTSIARGDRKAIELTVDAMTTNETLFFRDRHPFDTIQDILIPELIEKGQRQVTIWSAACSSGQEPYSLAMLLSERFPDLVTENRIRIVATDLSSSMIERCRAGRYSQFEVNRGLPAPLLMKYFEQEKRDWIVKPALKKMVRFEEHNLMGSWTQIPQADIVLMRNVLIYFTVDVKSQILGKVRSGVLKRGGALILGSSETTINIDGSFERESHGKSVVYRAP